MTVTSASWCATVCLIVAATPVIVAQEPQGRPSSQVDHQHHGQTESSVVAASEASGTAWLPDITPVYGFHYQFGEWKLMVHGNAFGQFLYEPGEVHHAGHQLGSINWLMGAADRSVGEGRLAFRAMVSGEPWTIGGCGYPDRLATGEVCEGDTLHDRQHPHDLFMELSALYDRPFVKSLRWQVYGGPAGEPALGPPAFPHRPSAFPNPIAPISHHWLDATHITFGVVTAGIYGARWKSEVSVFNGREPDDARQGFDLGALDSVSARFSWTPTETLALQMSGGHLRESEAGLGRQPRTDVERMTASAIYHRRFGADNLWATTLAYGRNSEWAIIPGDLIHQTTHALLLESSATAGEGHTWFGRLEVASKPAHAFHADEFATQIFTVEKLQIGYIRQLRPWNGLLPGIGATASASILPLLLAPRYGGRLVPGFGLFVTVRPRLAI